MRKPFPVVKEQNANEAEHRRELAKAANQAVTLDGSRQMTSGALLPPKYTVATAPNASDYEGGHIFVTDDVGGKTPAYSDGTNWLRYRDNAIIST